MFIAAFGFVLLNEKPSQISQRYKNIKEVIKAIPGEIKKSNNLKNFIISTNLIGITFVLIPFYVGFVKDKLEITEEVIGTFLVIQIVGMIVSNIFWHQLVKRFSFKGMLRVTIIINAILPIAALLLAAMNNISSFYVLFFINGSAISAQKIAYEGVLVEISNESNRPLYTGIFGTLNLATMIVPLLIGAFLVQLGIIYFLPFYLLSLYRHYTL